jgi:cytochrome P450
MEYSGGFVSDAAVERDLTPQQLLDPRVLDEPGEFYRRLREQAPVWRVPGTSIFVVSTFDAIAQAVVRPGDFSSNLRVFLYRDADCAPATLPFDGEEFDVLATADAPVHTLHRKSVFPELVAKRMAALRPEVTELADARIDGALATGSSEFMEAIANAVPIRVVSRLIGFEGEDPDLLLDAAFSSTHLLAATESLDELTRSMARTGAITDWIAAQLDRGIEEGGEGLLGLVGAAVAAGEMEHGAGVMILQTLLSAGGESTTSLLGNGAYLLATRPDLQETLRARPELLAPFIEEALRLESSFRYHMRSTPQATELCGVEIPAGATVLLLWGAANRDPAEFEDPDEIRLDRTTPRHHLGFGRGMHFCVGAPLARMQAEVVLGRFLARTREFKLDPHRPPTRALSLMVRRFTSLPLQVLAG